MAADDLPTSSPLLVVAAALIRGDGCVLVQQRPAGKNHAGLWEFPGGKVEPGESPEAALARELSEELGIRVEHGDVSPLTFASVSGGTRPLILLLYRAGRWAGEPRAIEAAALRWLPPASLHDTPMPPADVPFIAVLEAVAASVREQDLQAARTEGDDGPGI